MDAIPAWIQAITAVFTTILLLVTSVLAILGYLKVIKTADENAKERQLSLEKAGEYMVSKLTQRDEEITQREASVNSKIQRNAIGVILLGIAACMVLLANKRQ